MMTFTWYSIFFRSVHVSCGHWENQVKVSECIPSNQKSPKMCNSALFACFLHSLGLCGFDKWPYMKEEMQITSHPDS